MGAVVLDSGALIAVDRHGLRKVTRLFVATEAGDTLVTHPLVVTQVWRGSRQAELARFLKGVDVRVIDDRFGRQCGELLGRAKAGDPVDAAIVTLARDGDRILTSDPDDIRRLVETSERNVRVVPI